MGDLAVRALDFTGLRGTIDVIVGMEDTTRHKPDPEPVRFALKKLERDAADAVFLGDSPHDIASGNAAGVATVAALWGPFAKEELDAARPAHQVAKMRDFPALVARLERAR
jgi:pyrophosphatase PpaX